MLKVIKDGDFELPIMPKEEYLKASKYFALSEFGLAAYARNSKGERCLDEGYNKACSLEDDKEITEMIERRAKQYYDKIVNLESTLHFLWLKVRERWV